MPTRVEPIQLKSDQPPWEDVYGNIDIRCTVPQLNSKGEASTVLQKALTLEMIEDKYPQEAWTQVYTDWSATNTLVNNSALEDVLARRIFSNEHPSIASKLLWTNKYFYLEILILKGT